MPGSAGLAHSTCHHVTSTTYRSAFMVWGRFAIAVIWGLESRVARNRPVELSGGWSAGDCLGEEEKAYKQRSGFGIGKLVGKVSTPSVSPFANPPTSNPALHEQGLQGLHAEGKLAGWSLHGDAFARRRKSANSKPDCRTTSIRQPSMPRSTAT